MKNLIGTVTGQERRGHTWQWEIYCPDAPDYLETIFVYTYDVVANMRVGLKVKLVYVTSNSFGLWMVNEEDK